MDWAEASNFCVIVKIFEFYSLINCPLPLGLNAIFIQPVLRAHKLFEDFPDLYFDPTKTLHRASQKMDQAFVWINQNVIILPRRKIWCES